MSDKMREALIRAKKTILQDRDALIDSHTGPKGLDEAGRDAADEYDDVLRKIDEALAQAATGGEVVAVWNGNDSAEAINDFFAHLWDLPEGTKLYTAAPAPAVPDDAKLLNAVMENCWKVEPVGVPTGGDDYTVIWRVVEFHMPEREVEIARTDSDDPREAIRAAMLAAAPEVAAKGAQS